MLNAEKWKRLSGPLYTEEFILVDKAQDEGLTWEEQRRLEYLREVLQRFLARFLRHSQQTGEFSADGPKKRREKLDE